MFSRRNSGDLNAFSTKGPRGGFIIWAVAPENFSFLDFSADQQLLRQSLPNYQWRVKGHPLHDQQMYLKIILQWYRQHPSENSHLITDRPHHWIFFQRLHTSHLLTRWTSSAKCSGSDLMIWSNSANWDAHSSHLCVNTAVFPFSYFIHFSQFKDDWSVSFDCLFHYLFQHRRCLPFQGEKTPSSVQTCNHAH